MKDSEIICQIFRSLFSEVPLSRQLPCDVEFCFSELEFSQFFIVSCVYQNYSLIQLLMILFFLLNQFLSYRFFFLFSVSLNFALKIIINSFGVYFPKRRNVVNNNLLNEIIIGFIDTMKVLVFMEIQTLQPFQKSLLTDF